MLVNNESVNCNACYQKHKMNALKNMQFSYVVNKGNAQL